MEKKLSELRPGGRARVRKILGRGSIKRRMMDLGVVPGVEVEMERYAPLGDPVEIKIRNYHLSLRKEEAETVMLEQSGKEERCNATKDNDRFSR